VRLLYEDWLTIMSGDMGIDQGLALVDESRRPRKGIGQSSDHDSVLTLRSEMSQKKCTCSRSRLTHASPPFTEDEDEDEEEEEEEPELELEGLEFFSCPGQAVCQLALFDVDSAFKPLFLAIQP